MNTAWDRVYVTTLFSFEWKRTSDAIDFAIGAARGQQERVFVGGIAASLMHDEFLREPRWAGVRFIKGLLDGPPSLALQLSAEEFEFGAEDLTGKLIEELVPDYSILEQVGYRYPVNDAYFGYASRGCLRRCSFCGVPALEGDQREMPPQSTCPPVTMPSVLALSEEAMTFDELKILVAVVKWARKVFEWLNPVNGKLARGIRAFLGVSRQVGDRFPIAGPPSEKFAIQSY